MDPNSNQIPGLGLPQPPSNGRADAFVGSDNDDIATNSPLIAQSAQPSGDYDLEQEWVDRAKDIVEKTKGDPFAESKELNRIRAGYLEARHNKRINTGQNSQ